MTSAAAKASGGARRTLPLGATDTHLHIFGPVDRYPYSAVRGFTPPERLPAEYRRKFQALGFQRAVAVQPSVYGFDNSCQLDALANLGVSARAVVVVPTDIRESELNRLEEAGACGVRINNGRPGGLMLADLEALNRRLRGTGWHIQLVVNTSADLLTLKDRFKTIESELVIDHIGLVAAAEGLGQPAFKALLGLAESGRCWIKLSSYYQLSNDALRYRDVEPFVRKLVEVRPDRLLWGSDWPHPFFTDQTHINSADLLDCFLDWVPEVAMQRQILVENPEILYGF